MLSGSEVFRGNNREYDRRQLDDLDQAAARSIGDPDFPAGPADDFAGDREAQPGTRNFLASRALSARKKGSNTWSNTSGAMPGP